MDNASRRGGFEMRMVRLQPWKIWLLAVIGAGVALALTIAVAGLFLILVPVVLIGGLSSTVETWGRLAELLAQRYRVIRPDNRGSGRTRIDPDDGDRSMPAFAGDVRGLLDALGLDRVHLVGASMGGMIVQQFAVTWPERLLSLTIACSHCGGAAAGAMR